MAWSMGAAPGVWGGYFFEYQPTPHLLPCTRRPCQEAPMPLTTDQAYAELTRRAREAATLAGCASVLAWDEATYMPPRASAFRGEQMGLLARLGHEMATAPILGELLAQVEASPLVRDAESDAAANTR